MHKNTSIYAFSYEINESEVCKLESRQLFGKEERGKQLDSDIRIDPSHSAFLKKRLDVLCFDKSYAGLLAQLDAAELNAEGFKAEYVIFDGDATAYADRLLKLKDIGYRITGRPNVQQPTITYGLCLYQGWWCLGVLHKNNYLWRKHQQKPRSFSNSINIKLAKALVNMATQGDRSKRIIDACCGVGTVLLEACFASYTITGCDINWRVCVQSRENLAHFAYESKVIRSDIKDIKEHYDAAIIDLPYNLFSHADEHTLRHIIVSASQVAPRLLIVSTSDIAPLLSAAGLVCVDHCRVKKLGKKHFERRLWVCEPRP